jgi:mycothiol system anti-sigma-R factor
MDCQETHLRVYEYLDGELTVWKRQAITRHLDECPPCAEGFTFEIDLRRVVVSKCTEEVPVELKIRIALALGLTSAGDPAPE